MKYCALFILITCVSSSAWGDQSSASPQPASWRLEESDQGVEVYSRDSFDSAYREIKAQATVQSSLKKLISFLQDADINQQWVPYSGGVNIIDQPNSHTSYVHFLMNARWPFENRDSVAKFTLSQDTLSHVVTITILSIPDKIPPTLGRVRITKFSGEWRLAPTDANTTRITYQSHIEPGGFIPAWLSNSLSYTTTLKSLHNLRSLIGDYSYDQEQYPFISNAME
ncbi:hypothetical protein A9Q99_15995 [Gammaproteobacteria bacterium 45_16_T64]|nr:hypothetical protein A9Q99_15995 [Gammaproteobacteria bacterium 45_16_T64]